MMRFTRDLIRSMLTLLLVCALLVNSVLAAPWSCGDGSCNAGEVTQAAPDHRAAERSCCIKRCCGNCPCCARRTDDPSATESTQCRCRPSNESPALPARPDVSRSTSDVLAASDDIERIAPNTDPKPSRGRAAAAVASVPTLKGGVQVYYCIWLT